MHNYTDECAVTDITNTWEVDTGVTMIEEKRLQPRSRAEERKELEEGPLYRIIASLNKYEEAMRKRDTILKRAEERGERARVQIVPSSNEFAVLGKGQFAIRQIKQEVHGSSHQPEGGPSAEEEAT